MGGQLFRYHRPGLAWRELSRPGSRRQERVFHVSVHACNLFSCKAKRRWLGFHKVYLTDNYTKTNCAMVQGRRMAG